MTTLRLYARVLRLLGPKIWLGWTLAFANLALAAALFAEPVLFGRIIDSLAHAQGDAPGFVLAASVASARRLGWVSGCS